MDHGPAVKIGADNASARKARLGVILFIVYALVYAGFIAIGVTNYELMGRIVVGGQNLAVFYGFGLIVFAILLGLVYNFACTRLENKLNREEQL